MLPSRPPRRGRDFSQELAEKGWYHSFELPGGVRYRRPQHPRDPASAGTPDFPSRPTFAAGACSTSGPGTAGSVSRRSAAARRSWPSIASRSRTSCHVHAALGSKVDYRILDFYDVPERGPRELRLRLLPRRAVPPQAPSAGARDGLRADDGRRDRRIVRHRRADWREHEGDIPTLEFYETDELGNQLDNWFGPSVACLMAMCRAAGFARVELMHAGGFTAGVACFRRWEPAPENPAETAPELTAVMNTRTLGINFSTRKEEYLSCWFHADARAVARGAAARSRRLRRPRAVCPARAGWPAAGELPSAAGPCAGMARCPVAFGVERFRPELPDCGGLAGSGRARSR